MVNRPAPCVMMSCGEASGELYAASLARELRALAPGTRIVAMGGSQLREAGVEILADYHGISVTGLTEALRVIPRSLALIRELGAAADRIRPDVFVPIDFPDFNFRLMAAMKKRGIPVVYYISPQLWAWRAGRMRTMKRLVSKVLVIFPFEERIYRDAGVDAEFVGHPLVDLAVPSADRETLRARFGASGDAPLIALLPGSRGNELRAILPDMARAAALIARRLPDARFVLARAPRLHDDLFAPIAAHMPGLDVAMADQAADDVLAAADVAITASGTATVQAALHERPMVVVYRLSPLSALLGRLFVKLDTFGMVNLVAGERVVPELVQERFTPEAVADEVVSLVTDAARRDAMVAKLRDVKARLGGRGGARRAAEAILRATLAP
ncbi:MAG TPA: lipid-A-disaccharide synthase [Vicinamibacterales bacterium]|nr:lipid-A-disaccharide synthase [Vicinamibacterales bacterium]